MTILLTLIIFYTFLAGILIGFAIDKGIQTWHSALESRQPWETGLPRHQRKRYQHSR